jgi:hypothetical protein
MEDRPPDPVPPSQWSPYGEPSPSAPVIPWEQPGVPWTNGLVETIKLLITRPREAFERMPLTGDLLRPFVFAILLGWIGTIFGTIWQVAFQGAFPRHSGEPMPALFMPILALFAPVFIVFGLFVSAAFYHVMLLILGGARSGFAATLRVLCYSQAPQVFQLLPICGTMIAGVATLFLMIQGLAVAHRISLGKAALAVLLPAVLCCACAGILMVTVGATIFSRYMHGFNP